MDMPSQTAVFPWTSDSKATGDFAIQRLTNYLRLALAVNGRLHAETFLVAAGALAGFAAQYAALTRAAAVCKQTGVVPLPSIVVLSSPTENWLFGDWINAHIWNEPGSVLSLFGLVGGAALTAGMLEESLPKSADIASFVTHSIGGPTFGIVRAPEQHRPGVEPAEVLTNLWRGWVNIIRSPFAEEDRKYFREPPLKVEHWPMIASIVAANALTTVKNVLELKLGCALIIEAAVIASKLDPESIIPRHWSFEDVPGGGIKISEAQAH